MIDGLITVDSKNNTFLSVMHKHNSKSSDYIVGSTHIRRLQLIRQYMYIVRHSLDSVMRKTPTVVDFQGKILIGGNVVQVHGASSGV